MSEAFRAERDSLGLVMVPRERLYGAQTARAVANFPISGVSIATLPHLLTALAEVKIAAALANRDEGSLAPEKADAIIAVCREIVAGHHREEFVVDVFQGGAGTSTNMNMNEVVANLASLRLGGPVGAERVVHPNDEVNRSQSTNDAYATAARLSMVRASRDVQGALRELVEALRSKAEEFAAIPKLGRTQLQDAVGMTLGQEFGAFATTIGEDVSRLAEAEKLFLEINLGGTAIGSGVAAGAVYRERVLEHLREVTGLAVVPASDLFEASWDMGAFMLQSGLLKRTAAKLSKIANDLRLLSSGPYGGFGEIHLPALQPGSSLMPGKVNPVAAEALNQVCFHVYGLDTTIGMAAEAGQLQLNAMEPVIVYSLHQAMGLLSTAVRTFIRTCVNDIRPDAERCHSNLAGSSAFATELVTSIGYEAAAKLVMDRAGGGHPDVS